MSSGCSHVSLVVYHAGIYAPPPHETVVRMKDLDYVLGDYRLIIYFTEVL